MSPDPFCALTPFMFAGQFSSHRLTCPAIINKMQRMPLSITLGSGLVFGVQAKGRFDIILTHRGTGFEEDEAWHVRACMAAWEPVLTNEYLLTPQAYLTANTEHKA